MNSPYPSIPNEYFEKIMDLVQFLEKNHDIHILYAVENGSRSKGLWHTESDFDIRFIFKFNRSLLNTSTGRDLLDIKDTIEGISEDKYLDWQGWCIDKTIKYLKMSDPSIIEWLYSDIIYVNTNEFQSSCRNILGKMHCKKSLYYHYLNMGKKNWKMWILDKDQIIYKKYLYILRSLLMVIFIKSPNYENKKKAIIINDFEELLNFVTSMYPQLGTITTDNNEEHVYSLNAETLIEISLIITMKKHDKKYKGEPLVFLNKWIKQIFDYENNYSNTKSLGNSETNNKIVLQALSSTKDKLNNEFKKVKAISAKTGLINKNDYISFFNQYLLYIWLIQHPDKHSGEAPCQIKNILDEVCIDKIIVEWINNIILSKKEQDKSENLQTKRNVFATMFIKHLVEFLLNLEKYTKHTYDVNEVADSRSLKVIENNDSNVSNVSNVSSESNKTNESNVSNVSSESNKANESNESNESKESNKANESKESNKANESKESNKANELNESKKANESNASKELYNVLNSKNNEYEVTIDELRKIIIKTESGIINQHDFFNYSIRNYCSFLWFLRTDGLIKKYPKDIFSDTETDTIPKHVLDGAKSMVSILRPNFVHQIDENIHNLIQQDIDKYEPYVKEMTIKFAKKKEIDKQEMYKGSIQNVEPEEFMRLLEKFY